jgi:acyl-coenzyme A synthetase/AMP-(fatty) acid ligase
LAQSTGDFIIDNTKATLTPVYGSTETCILNYLIPPRQHWSAFYFHPTHGPDLEPEDPSSTSSLYEVVINKRKTVTLDHAIGQCIFQCFPQIEQWRTKDLFRKHETESGLWIFQGRKDDVIILSTGDKVNPVPKESLIQNHPMVTGALVFGNSRTKCGLLVEVKDHAHQKELLEAIWGLVVKENEDSRIPARIEQEMIRLASPAKPFVRAGKGTIVRSLTLEEYREEIKSMYGEHLRR